MAFGGGAFTAQNKTLPGAYMNFISAIIDKYDRMRIEILAPNDTCLLYTSYRSKAYQRKR